MPESDDAAVESLSTDRAFHLLGNATRRRALSALRQSDVAAALDDLAAEIAARDADATLADVSQDRCDRAAASLHHCHLPKLADADVVEYDPVANEVELLGRVEALGPYFDVIEGP